MQPIDGEQFHLRFRSEGKTLQDCVGCNQVCGRYEVDKERLRIIDLATTKRACNAGMETEERFLTGMAATATWKIRGNHLELYESDGRPVARFEARLPTQH